MIKELIKFIISAQYTGIEESFYKKTLLTILLFLTYLLSIVLFNIPSLLFKQVPSRIPDNTVNQSLETVLIATLFLAPLYEELIFRLPLKINSKTARASICAVTIFLFINILKIMGFNKFLFGFLYSVEGIFLQIVFFILFYFTLKSVIPIKVYKSLNETVNKNFKLCLFTFSLLFAISHIDFTNMNFIEYYKILPLTIGGYILAYARLRVGILSSIFIHFMNNFIVAIPLVF